MHEKKIRLEGIDPIEIYGANNTLIDRLCSYFPKLKTIIRGNEIFVSGSLPDIKKFEKAVYGLIDLRKKFRNLNPDHVDSVIEGNGMKNNDSKEDNDIILYGQEGKTVRARTANQKKMLQLYNSCDMIFAIGPAGSGKTYTAIAMAVRALKNREVKRIILTRPAVEAGEKLGFLPGDLKEKLDPYLQPLYDALIDMLPSAKLRMYMEDGTIQIAPLAYMRGRTLDNAFVILDEAQNTTMSQMKMFLTRMGNNAKFIITGDITQIDLPANQKSGLESTVKLVKGIKGIGVVNLTKQDIIRHKIVEKIVQAFARAEKDMEESTDNQSKNIKDGES